MWECVVWYSGPGVFDGLCEIVDDSVDGVQDRKLIGSRI